MTEGMKKELLPVIAGTAILSAVMIAIFAVLNICGVIQYPFLPALFGGVLGFSAASLNMLFLALSIEKSVDKKSKAASISMGTSYMLRLAMIAAIVLIAIKFNSIFNYLTAVIPLVFPQIVIMIIKTRRKEKKDEC